MCLDVHPEHPHLVAVGFYDGSYLTSTTAGSVCIYTYVCICVITIIIIVIIIIIIMIIIWVRVI